MHYRPLGSSGLRVSEISLGSWLTSAPRSTSPARAKVVARALELGVNPFDTADVYASGEAEQALREALRGAPRHKVVIATKCFFPMSEDPNDRGLSRKHLFESVDALAAPARHRLPRPASVSPRRTRDARSRRPCAPTKT